MADCGLTEYHIVNRIPSGLANQKGVCYSNAVLQCFAKFIDPVELGSKLRLDHPPREHVWYHALHASSTVYVDEQIVKAALENINPAVEFLRVLRSMQENEAAIVFPYYFQASLAAKGGENGYEFASGEGAYPYCWFRFVLNSLCEGVEFNGQSKMASHPVIDNMYKVHSTFTSSCHECYTTELVANGKAKTWGLQLDPKGEPLCKRSPPITEVQQLLDAYHKNTDTKIERCKRCHKFTRKYLNWKGLVTAPEVLPIDIKTYERTVSSSKRTEYKFLFSNIVLSTTSKCPLATTGTSQRTHCKHL